MQAGNLLFVLVIIFVNASITHAQQTCGQCISTAKSTFKSDKQTCRDDFRSGTIATRAELKACKMMKKSTLFSDMATCYQTVCTPAPTTGWVLGQAGGDCTSTCNNAGGTCNAAGMSAVTDSASATFVANLFITSPFTTIAQGIAGAFPYYRPTDQVYYGLPGDISDCDQVVSAPRVRLCCCGNNCPIQ